MTIRSVEKIVALVYWTVIVLTFSWIVFRVIQEILA